jgi:hypothetical protein
MSDLPSSIPEVKPNYPLKLLPRRGFGQTSRKDAWWLAPLLTFLGLTAFIVYSTWAGMQNAFYWVKDTNYLSPMYAPELFGASPHAWFGVQPAWWPAFIPFSPAILILWAPGGFRFTCYYYRGAYYKAFWQDPTSCAVGEPRKGYRGENSLPLILQNIHRYFLYFALIFLVLLAYDAVKSFWFGPEGSKHFGIGLGSLIMVANVCLLSSYTFGCHSLRHLIGGCKDELSKSPACHSAYKCVSGFNRKHMLFAWLSLFTVGFTDVYIRLCAMGIWHDWRIV